MPVVALYAVLLTAAPITVVAPGLRATGVAAEKVAFLSEFFSTQLQLAGMSVVTEKQMAAMLGLERQRQLLGCNANSAECFAELSNALGTDAVLIGEIAYFGTRFVGTLKIIRARDGKAVAVRAFDAATEDALLKELTSSAGQLAQDAERAFRPTTPAPGPGDVSLSRGGPSRTWALAPGILGAAGVVTGVVLLGIAGSQYSLLSSGTNVSRASSDAALQSGPLFQTGGLAALGIGAAVVVVAVVWWLLGAEPPPGATAFYPALVGSRGEVHW